ncbi:hypothetical protein OPKNFCMD_4727 [Methylobacterium crusticola]|uniref:DUF1501 domain-containing protein n=1 Tax=Methylobacterium crusticola TaxID=1697972 RepID=A0ABQ4R2S3_9HYPH|nr:DUF1501 domain-containing protein [Methylobacterium crusticola]GJD51968.1 hypothetical protein OPKNFCMD_4727 [Methylobacterium crusticola]
MDRRDLLTASLGLGLATVAGRVWAAPRADARLLVVFLRGAYDAASVVIPTGSDFYYRARRTLAVARPSAADPAAALPLDADWSLHPALRETILPLWARGQAAFVPFAGTDDLTRSHFETQDTIEMGQTAGAARDYNSGFMARLAAELTRARPVAFTEQMPLVFRGGEAVPNVAINQVGKPGIDERQARLIAAMYRGHPLAGAVDEGFRVREAVYQTVSDHAMQADRGAVSPRGFELAARRIGRLMREQFTLGFVDVGGWDTHVNQGAGTGYLADRLGELGRGLAGFAQEIGAGWDATVVVVLSEFGRTFRENGSRGTDHGHGSVYWVLGGGVRGGRIAGPQVRATEANLFQNRDYPVLTDYRSLLAGLLARLYGLDQASLRRVFPGVGPADLALV